MAETITPPTCEQLFDNDDDEIKSVHRKPDDSWRHGCYITHIFHRKSDGTYWKAYYRLSTDGETNELEEGYAKITQVTPVEKTIIDYVEVAKENG